MGDAFRALNTFAGTLQSHRMIKLYNDGGATSCYLPRGLIEKASNLLVSAIKEPDDADPNTTQITLTPTHQRLPSMASHSASDESCGIISTATFEATASFARELMGDFPVRVYVKVNDDICDGPYLVPLMRFAQPHFKHLIKDEFCTSMTSSEGYDVRMDITSYGSLEAAIILLQYIVLGSLPSDFEEADGEGERPVALARAWILGHEYRLPEFQGMVMVALLNTYEVRTFTSASIAKIVAVSPSNSKLRHFLLDLLAIRIDEKLSGYGELEQFASSKDFWKDWAFALEKRLESLVKGNEEWKALMVGDGMVDRESVPFG